MDKGSNGHLGKGTYRHFRGRDKRTFGQMNTGGFWTKEQTDIWADGYVGVLDRRTKGMLGKRTHWTKGQTDMWADGHKDILADGHKNIGGGGGKKKKKERNLPRRPSRE